MNNQVVLSFQKLHPQVNLPRLTNEHAACYDVEAFIQAEGVGRARSIIIPPRQVKAIPTGLVSQIPQGYYLEVLSRSGLAKNNSVFVANAPGVVDPDYEGQIYVLLYNGGLETHYVLHGDRVAQFALRHLVRADIQAIQEIAQIEGGRGDSGFGSTGR